MPDLEYRLSEIFFLILLKLIRVIKLKKMQILLFSLIPVGILLLVISVKSVRKTFSGDTILELPYTTKIAEFLIKKPGYYAVWHKGQFFRRAPLDEFRPVITNKFTGEAVNLSPSLFRPNTNNGVTAKMELFRFRALEGKYVITLEEGASISTPEQKLIELIPARKADPDQYYILIRESQSRLAAFAGVILIAISGLLIIGGFVTGLLADQIFSG